MDGHVARIGEMRNTRVCSMNLKGADNMEDLGVGRKIILK
jgi:hypothetical protein